MNDEAIVVKSVFVGHFVERVIDRQQMPHEGGLQSGYPPAGSEGGVGAVLGAFGKWGFVKWRRLIHVRR
jgi:hypothetical protein